jgi:hypothetical protein
LSGFAIAGTQNATQVIITNATGVAGNSTYTVQFTGVTNPNVANTSFYTRITTYDSDVTQDGTTDIDYGAMCRQPAKLASRLTSRKA